MVGIGNYYAPRGDAKLSWRHCQHARHTDELSLLLAQTTVMEMMVSDGTSNLANLRTAVPSAPCQDSAAAGESSREAMSWSPYHLHGFATNAWLSLQRLSMRT